MKKISVAKLKEIWTYDKINKVINEVGKYSFLNEMDHFVRKTTDIILDKYDLKRSRKHRKIIGKRVADILFKRMEQWMG